MSNCTCNDSAQANNTHLFDARGVARRFRHASIFGALESLTPGETMRFVNDHDPLPLLAQLRNYFGPRIDIGYVARNPEEIVIDFTVKA
ncbi:DUF2249 domain-containing protein [Massilia agilis]|uniref:DUF2249 domain-containing protein n=2 Tax=Massilia TaxID=149698 RepID=A0ABT2BRA5_9BURK|nr:MULTISPECIES: DUF2249 domain-containing protein [Massilia]MCS0610398.1 DUF2249 domain-containing protein [Massilia solisilvae]MCS0810704.1 DUF2249 domain-containing protein [Massilia agilis]